MSACSSIRSKNLLAVKIEARTDGLVQKLSSHASIITGYQRDGICSKGKWRWSHPIKLSSVHASSATTRRSSPIHKLRHPTPFTEASRGAGATTPFLSGSRSKATDGSGAMPSSWMRRVELPPGLVARGVKLGDRVLVHLDNCPESIFSWFACSIVGASAVTTNARSVADELAYYADNAEVVGAITQPRFAELVQASTDPGFLIVTETDNGVPPGAGTHSIRHRFIRATVRESTHGSTCS